MRSSIGAICASPIISNRQAENPITWSAVGQGTPVPYGFATGDPTRARLEDAELYGTGQILASAGYVEILRLDFAAPIFIQDISLIGLGAQDHFGSGIAPGMQFFVSGDFGGDNVGANAFSTAATSANYGPYTVNADHRYLSLYARSILNFQSSLYNIDVFVNCFRVTGGF